MENEFKQLTAKERLLLFIDRLGVSVRQFEAKAGVSNGAITHSKGDFTQKFYDKIFAAYPISRTWLIAGVGSMFEGEEAQDVNIDLSHHNASGDGARVEDNSIQGDNALAIRYAVMEKELEMTRANLERADKRISELEETVARLQSEKDALQHRIIEKAFGQ